MGLAGLMRNRLAWGFVGSAAIMFTVAGVLFAGERNNGTSAASTREPIELFDAIDAGLVDVKFIPRNDEQARILVHNKTNLPPDVRLPDAFA